MYVEAKRGWQKLATAEKHGTWYDGDTKCGMFGKNFPVHVWQFVFFGFAPSWQLKLIGIFEDFAAVALRWYKIAFVQKLFSAIPRFLKYTQRSQSDFEKRSPQRQGRFNLADRFVECPNYNWSCDIWRSRGNIDIFDSWSFQCDTKWSSYKAYIAYFSD